MNNWQRKYLFRFISGMAGYAILLSLIFILVDNREIEPSWLVILLAFLPLAPFLNAMSAVIHNVRSQDELHHRINLEAVLITTLITGGLTLSYGLLETAELVPHMPTVIIAPFMIFVWGIANIFVSRRYG